MRRYNPNEIEPKWQRVWEKSGLYKTDMSRTRDKYYVIPMLPYPSGDLHVGHWYNFAPTDAVARFHRMRGQNVLTTIGFDAFGLPAENAAIQRGIQPAKWTHSNIATMTKQIQQIGASYDWDHSLATCDPDYYRWNQWLFLKLYEKGLAYRAKAIVNWCPKDQTVLANEQVVGLNNVCERCGTPVIQKEMEQWFFKITDFTDRLLADLDKVDWPEKVKTMQINWIGRSIGAEIDFTLADSKEKIKVFTIRPDTIFGATYLVLAPEHPLAEKLLSNDHKAKGEEYIKAAGLKTELERKEGEKDKTGVPTGAYAVNPANKEKIPIWIADYVLMGYGTGAIMAVPAHDKRDHDFAEKYDLPIQPVIAQVFGEVASDSKEVEGVVVIGYDPATKKFMGLKNGEQGWLVGGGREQNESFETAAKRELAEEAGYEVDKLIPLGGPVISYYHNPIKKSNRRSLGYNYLAILDSSKQPPTKQEAHEDFKVQWVDFDMLYKQIQKTNKGLGAAHWLDALTKAKKIVEQIERGQAPAADPYSGEGVLINSGEYDGLNSAKAREKIVAELAGTKERTNYRLRDWLISRQRYWGTPIPIVYCGKCGTQPVPEDQLPVILPEDVEFELTGRSPLLERQDFVITKCPKCGGSAERETDTMDTFVDSSWYFLRYIDNKNDKAPFDTGLVNKWAPLDHYIGGIEHAILHLLYARFITKFLHDNHGLAFDEPFKKLTNQGLIMGTDGQKMSKSRGNVVSPDEQAASYGADSLRLYLMFMGPYDQGGPYNMGGIAGTRRFLDRLWTLVGEFTEAESKANSDVKEAALTAAAHRAIKKVTQDLERLDFNTAIAAQMSLVNELYKIKAEDGISQTPAWRSSLETLVQLLAPLAPHFAEELWQELGHRESVHISRWPAWDESLISEESITLAIQINGKVRAEIIVPADTTEKEAIESAKAQERIAELLRDQEIKKTIYVPGRLVNLVT